MGLEFTRYGDKRFVRVAMVIEACLEETKRANHYTEFFGGGELLLPHSALVSAALFVNMTRNTNHYAILNQAGMKTAPERQRFLWFMGTLAIIALAISAHFTIFRKGLNPFSILRTPQYHQNAKTDIGLGQQNSPRPPNPYVAFSAEARQVIAATVAHQNDTAFARIFTIRCLSASQSRRKFTGYGVNTELAVVTALFQVSATTNNAAGLTWSKIYMVSETVDAAQFQGLTSADTVERVVEALKERMQSDNEFLSILQKAVTP